MNLINQTQFNLKNVLSLSQEAQTIKNDLFTRNIHTHKCKHLQIYTALDWLHN